MSADRFEYILRYGDHPHKPEDVNMFLATDAIPGSREKIEIMRRRHSLGQPIFHEKDRTDYNGAGLLGELEKFPQ